MIIERRVFQAKVGQAAAVVEKVKEFQTLADQYMPGLVGANRVYTDFLSGPTDRVAWEWDYESLAQFESMMTEAEKNAEAMKAYNTWFEGLKPLLEGATVELWKRESP